MSGKSPRAKVRLQPPGTSERREQSRAARGWMALRADNQRHAQLRFIVILRHSPWSMEPTMPHLVLV